MTDQPGDYYVAESVSWIDSVEGLSDTDRAEGREVFAVLLAHHDMYLHGRLVSFDECLRRARMEFAPDNDSVHEPERRDAALVKLNALPAFDETVLAASIEEDEARAFESCLATLDGE